MTQLWGDLRYSVRSLRNHPGFAVAAVVTLAIAIAANTAVFSVVSAVLLNPLSMRHMHDSGKVVTLFERYPALSSFISDHFSPRAKTIAHWEKQSHSLEEFGLLRVAPVAIQTSAGAQAKHADGALITPGFLSLFGVSPAIGRGITWADKNKQVALITSTLYSRMFHNDPNVLGRNVIVNGFTMRIVGVLRPDFELPSSWGGSSEQEPQVLSLLDQDLATDKDKGFDTNVYARLRPGYTVQQAQAELDAIAMRLQKSDAEDYAGFYTKVKPLLDETVGTSIQQGLLMLQIAVAFVLMIGCANVGNLLLTRAVARDKEIAVRVAMGAGRWRVVRQILAESLLLAVVASAIGIGLTYGALHLTAGMVPDVRGFHEVRVDGPVFLFTVGASLLCGVLFSVPAIWRAWNVPVNETLNRSSRSVSGSSTKLRTGLAVAQLALSLVLLVGAGLLLRSLQALLDFNLGFNPEHLVSVLVYLPADRYQNQGRLAAFNGSLLSAAENLPGVETVAISNVVPLRAVQATSFEIPGRAAKKGQQPASDWAITSAGYFKALGVQVLRGRTYTPGEVTSNAPVLVINQQLANTFWPGQDPIGKVVKFGSPVPRELRIIGIVGDESQTGPDNERGGELYMPGLTTNQVYLIARTTGDASRYATALTTIVKRMDPALTPNAETAATSLHGWLTPHRFTMTVIGCFAGVSMVLSAIGLYSLLAYSTTLRTREIGIRLAIGADPAAVRRMILRNAIMIAGVGIVIGLACAFALTRFMTSLIFGVSASDPITFATVTVVLALVSLLAGYAPARRAAKVDPLTALRQE